MLSCATGGNHSLFVDERGEVWGCGDNSAHQLGPGTPFYFELHKIEELPANIKVVACANDHSLFLDEDGIVWTIGKGPHTNGKPSATPTKFEIGVPITFMTGGQQASKAIFIDQDGGVWAYGNNLFHSIGLPEQQTYTVPTKITNLPQIIMVSCGFSHSLFLDAERAVWATGKNQNGELGLGDKTNRREVSKIGGLPEIKCVSCFSRHSLFLDMEGRVWVTGDNSAGQLGINSQRAIKISTPHHLDSLPPILSISAGYSYSLFADENGSAWSCGDNSYGQLGLGDKQWRNLPTKVPKLSRVSGIVASKHHSFFIEDDGSVWACGSNQTGQLSFHNSLVQHVLTSACKKKVKKISHLKLTISLLIDFSENSIKSARV